MEWFCSARPYGHKVESWSRRRLYGPISFRTETTTTTMHGTIMCDFAFLCETAIFRSHKFESRCLRFVTFWTIDLVVKFFTLYAKFHKNSFATGRSIGVHGIKYSLSFILRSRVVHTPADLLNFMHHHDSFDAVIEVSFRQFQHLSNCLRASFFALNN